MNIVICHYCKKPAKLVTGKEIYPYRKDLHDKQIYSCSPCDAYVGCHHKTENRTNPLGHISTPELKREKIKIHALIDPLWKQKKIKRGDLYARISKEIGWSYHTGRIKTLDECKEIFKVAEKICLEVSA